MPATRASLGYGAIFSIATAASPLGFTAVIEMKSIDPGEFSLPKIKATHLLSPNRTEEYIAGLFDPTEVAISGNFIGDESQSLIDTIALTGDSVNYKITAPVDGGSKTFTRVGLGFISKIKKGPFTNDNPAELMFSLQTSGFPTDTVA
jgi:hypothetical protein